MTVATGPRLRAFVAMRIGDPETDRLYRRSIAPAIRAARLKPIRIDKVPHNEDIDDRIIAEIRRATVVVTDLTFARPSAYFEAGFAFGLGIPVVYTTRNDHFRDRDDDPLGNHRVHFDLQMKNIIGWTDPDSAAFRKKLESRLRLVVAPLLQQQTQGAAVVEARVAFSKLSLSSRLGEVAQAAQDCLRALGYDLTELGVPLGWVYSKATRLVLERTPDNLLMSGFVGTRKTPGAIDAVWVRIAETFPMTALRPVNTLMEFSPPHDMNPPKGVRPNRVVEHVILCSLRSLPTTRVQTAFASYHQIGDREFRRTLRHFVPRSRIGSRSLLIGRNSLGPLWTAMAFHRNEPHATTQDYKLRGDDILEPARRRLTASIWDEHPQDKVIGHVRDVPRSVHVHVVDGLDSALALDEGFGRLRERFSSET